MGNSASTNSKNYETDSQRSSMERSQAPDASPHRSTPTQSNIPFLIIQTKTWNKNSFGLFDYESREIQKKQFKVSGTLKLMRHEIVKDTIEIDAVNEQHSKPDTVNGVQENQLARFLYRNGGYWIYHKNQVDLSELYQNHEEKLWLVVKHYQNRTSPQHNKGYRLEKNDIVKFGRVRLRVRDIDYSSQESLTNNKTKESNNQEYQDEMYGSGINIHGHQSRVNGQAGIRSSLTVQRRQTQDDIILGGNAGGGIGASAVDINDVELNDKYADNRQPFEISGNDVSSLKKLGNADKLNISRESDKPTCKICWGADEGHKTGSDFNPLISPCKCIGTISNIHLKCLKEWLETKRTMKIHRNQVIVKFKKLDCELCKQVFPFSIQHGNRIVDIVEIEKPHKDFIIFESLNSQSQKVFFIINTENKPLIKIGRGQESDIRITDDISVSRCHATIKRTPKGDYIMEDFNSKFGTLVQVQYPVLLTPQLFSNQNIVFQSGKTCLTINVKQNVSCMPGCFKANTKNKTQSALVSLDQNNRHLFPKEFLKAKIRGSKDAKEAKGRVMIAKGLVEDNDRDEEGEQIEGQEDQIAGNSGAKTNVRARNNSEDNSEEMENNNQIQQRVEGVSGQNRQQQASVIQSQPRNSANKMRQPQHQQPQFEDVRIITSQQNQNDYDIQENLYNNQPQDPDHLNLNISNQLSRSITNKNRQQNNNYNNFLQGLNDMDQQMLRVGVRLSNVNDVGQISGDNMIVEEEKVEVQSVHVGIMQKNNQRSTQNYKNTLAVNDNVRQ
eukprot:403335468